MRTKQNQVDIKYNRVNEFSRINPRVKILDCEIFKDNIAVKCRIHWYISIHVYVYI